MAYTHTFFLVTTSNWLKKLSNLVPKLFSQFNKAPENEKTQPRTQGLISAHRHAKISKVLGDLSHARKRFGSDQKQREPTWVFLLDFDVNHLVIVGVQELLLDK